jgi:LynF/TruF/PatF family peptide O-prenyltransferase
MIVAEIQKNSLKEQRIQFVRNHQQAFDVEPIYTLRLFEDFVMEVEGDCNIEASCKIELDKLIASRFMLFFKDQSQEWQKCLTQSLAFFLQVENRVGVQLDYSLLQKFLGHNFDFTKLIVLSMWVGTTQKELEKTKIDNIRLYYYKSFKME